MKKLGKLEDLEERLKMPLDELVKEYELYQQAFYAACWELAKKDDRGCWDEMEASDEWSEVCMKRAEEALKEIIT